MITSFFIAVFVWLLILTILLIKTTNHYQELVKGTNKRRLNEILDQLVEDKKKSIDLINDLQSRLKSLEEEKNFYLQKIGLVRYNPFEEKGEKSFVLSLLDKNNSGILLNCIYTRDGLRIYFKEIIKGKQEKGQLSEEEEKAVTSSHFLKT